MSARVVLAYSGGLDSSICLRILSKGGAFSEVIPVLVDVGQPRSDIVRAVNLAKSLGSDVLVIDQRAAFVRDFIVWAVRANARLGRYTLGTAMSRQLIAQTLVDVCKTLDVHVIATGCTGKGNDIVRFNQVPKDLGATLESVTPVADNGWRRRDLRQMADAWSIPYEIGLSHDYNLWGHSIGSGELQSIGQEVPPEKYLWTDVAAERVPPLEMTIEFHEGAIVSIDEESNLVAAIENLNASAGMRKIGQSAHVESGISGLKSWEVYEAPAAEVILELHSVLESATLERSELQLKHQVDFHFSQLIYDGRWFHPLTIALRSFLSSQQKRVSGAIRAKVDDGKLIVCNVSSPNLLFDPTTRCIE